MTKPDPLKSFFEAGDAPAVDPGFRTIVMERVAQRRLQLSLARAALAGLAVFVALLLLRPVVLALAAGLSASLGEILLMLVAIGLTAFAGHYLVTRTLPLPGWVQRLL
jgi:hypothetical protein